VFEIQEYEEEELRMKKEATTKPDPTTKQPEKITMKNLEKNNPIKPAAQLMESDDYPTLTRAPELSTKSAKQQPKNKQK